MSHYREIGCQQLWFKIGVKDRLRFIPVHDVSTNLGPEICSALPAFHALTGCDSTSAFLRIGKKKAWKVLTKSTAHQNSLACVGQSLNIDEDIVEKIEAFVRSLYAISAKGPKTVDEARYVMFCQTSKSNMALPPTSDSLLQHTKRANYQAYVWKKALVATQRLPSPDGHGWKLEDNSLVPHLMTKPPAPSSILELTNCKCSKSSCTQNCSCSNNGLACTEACKCMADEKCRNPNKILCDNSENEDSENSDSY